MNSRPDSITWQTWSEKWGSWNNWFQARDRLEGLEADDSHPARQTSRSGSLVMNQPPRGKIGHIVEAALRGRPRPRPRSS